MDLPPPKAETFTERQERCLQRDVSTILREIDELKRLTLRKQLGEEVFEGAQHPHSAHIVNTLDAYRIAEETLDQLIAKLYARETMITRPINMGFTRASFDFSYGDIPPEELQQAMQQPAKTYKESVEDVAQLISAYVIEIRDGRVYLNSELVSTIQQVQDVRSVLRPLTAIAGELKQGLESGSSADRPVLARWCADILSGIARRMRGV